MKTIALKSGKHTDMTIGLCSKLHETKLVQDPMKVNLGEQCEVIALLFGSAVDRDMLSWHLFSMGLLFLVKRNIMILIIQNYIGVRS
jgi:hypothetical protein